MLSPYAAAPGTSAAIEPRPVSGPELDREPNVRLVRRATALLSLRHPETLFVSICGSELARAGRVVTVPPLSKWAFLALASRPGYIVPIDELAELLWGDREDGGPDNARLSIHQHLVKCRRAGIALGYIFETHHGRGFSCRPIPVDFARAAA